MDISSKGAWPSNALSNFTAHHFTIDSVECASMEGFLQSLKFKNPDMQREVCKLVGRAAKMKGKGKNWQERQTLFWKGLPIKRDSSAYQILLTKAFDALSQNDGFRRALKASGNATFTHAMGRNKINETVLTTNEFCSQLLRLRNQMNES